MNGEPIIVEIGMKPSPQEETILNAIDLSWTLYRMLIDEILLHVPRNPQGTAISVRPRVGVPLTHRSMC
jgi:hypothetical protein